MQHKLLPAAAVPLLHPTLEPRTDITGERKAAFARFIQGAGPNLKIGDMFQNENNQYVQVKEIHGSRIVTELVPATANRALRRKAAKKRRKEKGRDRQATEADIRREVPPETADTNGTENSPAEIE